MTSTNKALLKRLKKVEVCDSSFMPPKNELVLHKAQGSTIIDIEGKEYIDLIAGFGALLFGHNPEYITSYFQNNFSSQSKDIIHGLGDVYPSLAKIELLESITNILPQNMSKTALAMSGSGAVEIAIKTAQLYTKKDGFISFERAYHGLDLGILPLTARNDFKEPFTGFIQTQNVEHAPYMCDKDVLQQHLNNLQKRGCKLAGIIVEPIQGRGGVHIASSTWLTMLRDFCKEHNSLLIFDEILTGLGRTGAMFIANSEPCDIICMGKALGGSMPISACSSSDIIMQAWPQNKGEALHTGTFFGHPLSTKIAKLTLNQLNSSNILTRVDLLGKKALKYLQTKLTKLAIVRGKGLMIGIELLKQKNALQIVENLRYKGVLVLASGAQANVISITPAFNIKEGDFFKALDKIILEII